MCAVTPTLSVLHIMISRGTMLPTTHVPLAIDKQVRVVWKDYAQPSVQLL